MADTEVRAYEMLQAAEKKAKSIWPGSSKYEEAEEKFAAAGNLFKTIKKMDEAANAYKKAGEMSGKLGNQHDQATHYVNAANVLKKMDVPASAELLRMAVTLFCELGRFNMASKNQKDLAEMLEESGAELPESIAAYEAAAEYYNGENATTSANKMLLKVGMLSAQIEKYERAVEVFEAVAASSLDSQLTKFSVKGYFLSAGLCHLATGEIVAARRALERYLDMDLTFHGCREAVFLEDICKAFEDNDVDEFTAKVIEFDRISKLNNWQTTMLLRIKNHISGAGDGGGDEDIL
eukprot:c32474_g1_i1.p2 GENE.c32474_g1_i1~~c32474_g1_i1.p2  ORF type:complete len:302 (+),score=93.32 c32474_g1_i1:30-908(+)